MNEKTDPPNEPIDAEFETEVPRGGFAGGFRSLDAGPGWIALGGTGVAAALLGALISGGLNLAGTGGNASGSLAAEMAAVSERQDTAEAGLADLAAKLANAEARLSREIAGVAAGAGDEDAIAALTTELGLLNARLDELSPEDGEGGLQDAIARIDALERADEDDITSPRLMNRAVTALRERVEAMETAQADIASRQALRAEALADLAARVDALPEATGGEGGTANALVGDLASLRAEIETLKAALAETSALDAEALQAEVEAIGAREAEANAAQAKVRNTTQAMIALLNVEAAARQGRPFQSAYAELVEALPGNADAARLAPLAASGAPTFASLQAGFDAAAREARKAADAEAAGGDGWGWVRSLFGEGVEVRRAGEAATELGDALGTARDALAAEDLAAAVAGVRPIGGAAGEALAGWISLAEQRLALENGLDTLRLTLLGTDG